jgi:ribosomal protein S18 acetylase RimI-like enzyme
MKIPIIVQFDTQRHSAQVDLLWEKVFGDEATSMTPDLVIEKDMKSDKGLSFVALSGKSVIGAIMAGYDGHRGWIYAIAVLPNYQRQGIGSSLLAFAEQRLSALGCRKINLQTMEGNEAAERFFSEKGYQMEKRISMGKRIFQSITDSESLRTRAEGFAKALDKDDFESAKAYLAQNCRYLTGDKDIHGPDAIIQNFREGSEKAKRLFDHVDYGSEILDIGVAGVVVQFTDLIEITGQSHIYSSKQHLEFGDDGLIIRIIQEEIPGELEALEAIIKKLRTEE